MSELLDTSYDTELSGISKLTWLPWVGKNYRAADKKVLIIWESHYDGNNVGAETNRYFTREILQDVADCQKTYPTYERTLHLLFEVEKGAREKFFANFAAYNFFQVAMKDTKERPNWKQPYWGEAGGVFEDVVKVLKPDFCLFCGVEACNVLRDWMGYSETRKKVGRVYGRKFDVDKFGAPIYWRGICHPSARGYREESWQSFLEDKAPELWKVVLEVKKQ